MKILVIGGGGREHSIAWKLAQSPQKPALYFAPGNPGMASLGQRLEIDPLDIQGLLIYARREGIDLTVVGPEAPLAAGIVDAFQAAGLLIFGPNKAAARLEASKAFAKEMMHRAQVPTAGYRFCTTEVEAEQALSGFSPPYVIKQDGLAAGKGVTIAANAADAVQAIGESFEAGVPVVIEEFLQGQEISILAVCDGTRALPLVGAQDHKKVGEGDSGPNTGGMGAYAPVPFADEALIQKVQDRVFDPVMRTLADEGIQYRGILYAGLMVTPDGEPFVIEFNARFGDPETQVILPLMADDLVEVCLASARGDLSGFAQTGIRFDENRSAVTVVLASEGYPGSYEKGKPIAFPESTPEDVLVFHAGTALSREKGIVTAGGRVLNVTGLGASLQEAREKAYAVADQIRFAGKFYRKDIGYRALSLSQFR